MVDLVLESLKDQTEAPDPELLEAMEWTGDDLKRFLARWEQLRAQARDAKHGTSGKDWDNALRSLGLQPQTQSRQDQRKRDAMRNLRNQGRRVRLPYRHYQELFEAYRNASETSK